MEYRINVKDRENLVVSIGKDSISNEHSLNLPISRLENFVMLNVDSTSNVLFSCDKENNDIKITKLYLDSKQTDLYYFNKDEFKNNEFLKNVVYKINRSRVEKSASKIVDAYLKNNVNDLEKDMINIDDEEYKNFVFANKDRILEILKLNDFKDFKLNTYEIAFVLSLVTMAASFPAAIMTDLDTSVGLFTVGSIATITFGTLKDKRKNKLMYDKLFDIYHNNQDINGFVRKKVK